MIPNIIEVQKLSQKFRIYHESSEDIIKVQKVSEKFRRSHKDHRIDGHLIKVELL
jgi:hypothetical protein